MSSATFGQPSPFGGPPDAKPEGPVEEPAPRNRRLLMLGAVGAAGVLTAVGAFFVLPAVSGGNEAVPPATEAAAAPAPDPTPEPAVEPVPESALPTLTQVAGRNPFQPQVGGGAGAPAAAADGTTAVAGGGTDGASGGGAGAPGPAGPAGPEGPAGPAGFNGIDGRDGLNGLKGVDGVDGAPGAPAEYVSVTYRGPNEARTAGIFEVITREGFATLEVKPASTPEVDGQPRETGRLIGDGTTASSFVQFDDFAGADDERAVLTFTPPPLGAGTTSSRPYTIDQSEPLNLFVPTFR